MVNKAVKKKNKNIFELAPVQYWENIYLSLP